MACARTNAPMWRGLAASHSSSSRRSRSVSSPPSSRTIQAAAAASTSSSFPTEYMASHNRGFPRGLTVLHLTHYPTQSLDQVLFYRALRNSHSLRDLPLGQTFELTQLERLPA